MLINSSANLIWACGKAEHRGGEHTRGAELFLVTARKQREAVAHHTIWMGDEGTVNMGSLCTICSILPRALNCFKKQIQVLKNDKTLESDKDSLPDQMLLVRKMIFSVKLFVTLLGYLKIPQVTILGDLHV
jgi:hypothetical protein